VARSKLKAAASFSFQAAEKARRQVTVCGLFLLGKTREWPALLVLWKWTTGISEIGKLHLFA
jgi:hypothetical protein